MDTSIRRIKPVEGEWFRVEPSKINRNLFKTNRWNGEEEQQALNRINHSFQLLDANPNAYGKSFEILIPKKIGKIKRLKK